MGDNNTKFWIQFSNGYSNASFQAVRYFLNVLAEDNFDGSIRTAIETINDLIVCVGIAENKDEAIPAFYRLVGFTEGLAVSAHPAAPEGRVYQYLYDALSLAEIVPYDDRLDD